MQEATVAKNSMMMNAFAPTKGIVARAQGHIFSLGYLPVEDAFGPAEEGSHLEKAVAQKVKVDDPGAASYVAAGTVDDALVDMLSLFGRRPTSHISGGRGPQA